MLDLVGKVAVCSKGRPGLVTGRKTLPWGESWIGVGLDGVSPEWASRNPTVIADSMAAYQDMSRPGWITTYPTGTRFRPLEPRAEDIHLVDIAHALAHMCRYTGHVASHYSVAQHCVLVSENIERESAVWGLLHDAAEAYLVDVSRPVKHSTLMQPYRDAEHRLQALIYSRFGLVGQEPVGVKEVDGLMLRTEQRDLTKATEWALYRTLPTRIEPWPADMAKRLFLERAAVLGVK